MILPFLKWAGGKRWAVAAGAFPYPPMFKRYFEPFLGSGSVFFSLLPENALLSDVNSELIELYEVMRDEPSGLFVRMERHHRKHCKTYYYEVRGLVPQEKIDRAARTLYLNRTCWNGLYRVNLKGQFNVPIGTKDKVILDSDNFHKTAAALSNANIKCCDFGESINQAEEDDFVFIDSPYTVKHNTNGFLKYNEKIFSWDDQVRLKNSIALAAERGVKIMATNANHESIIDLYDGVCQYRTLERFSVLSGDPAKRGMISEILLTANL